MYSKYQIIKILENCFQNIKCFSWIKLIPVLIHLKYWYYNSPYLELPCLPHHVLHRFLYFLYPIRSQNTTSSEYTKPYAKTSQSNFFWSYIQIIIPSGSTRCPSKNWVFKSRFSFKVMQHSQQQHKVLHLQDKVCQVGKCSFIFTTLLVQTNNATIFTKKPFLYFSQFLPPIPPLFVQKTLRTISTNIPFFYASAIFHRPFLRTTIQKFCTKYIFPISSIFPI